MPVLVQTKYRKAAYEKGRRTNSIGKYFRHLTIVLVFVLYCQPAHAAQLSLAWNSSSGATGYKLYYGFEEDMNVNGIGSVSEIYDGDPPHTGRGAISQAWSVAALLRIRRMIKNYSTENA